MNHAKLLDSKGLYMCKDPNRFLKSVIKKLKDEHEASTKGGKAEEEVKAKVVAPQGPPEKKTRAPIGKVRP